MGRRENSNAPAEWADRDGKQEEQARLNLKLTRRAARTVKSRSRGCRYAIGVVNTQTVTAGMTVFGQIGPRHLLAEDELGRAEEKYVVRSKLSALGRVLGSGIDFRDRSELKRGKAVESRERRSRATWSSTRREEL